MCLFMFLTYRYFKIRADFDDFRVKSDHELTDLKNRLVEIKSLNDSLVQNSYQTDYDAPENLQQNNTHKFLLNEN
jgi:hypothetical protein